MSKTTVATSLFGHKHFFHEFSIRSKDLDAVVRPVADIEKTVVRQRDAVDRIAELFGRW